MPAKLNQKFHIKRLHFVLLLLLAGDVELNPGPAQVDKTVAEGPTEVNCPICGSASDSLMLRSRAIADAVIKCKMTHCDRFVHRRCRDHGDNNHETEWTCADHSQTGLSVQGPAAPDDSPARSPHPAPEPTPPTSTDAVLSQQPEPEATSATQKHSLIPSVHLEPHAATAIPDQSCPETSAPPNHPEPEAIPGPSFATVKLMDVMEALRLTQLKLDKVSGDVDELKKLIQNLPSHDNHKPTASFAEEESHRSGRQAPPQTCLSSQPTTQGRQDDEKSARPQRIRKLDTLIIGDSNVGRLKSCSTRQNVTFRPVSGATIEQLERDTRKTPDELMSSDVVLHVGTNDLAGSGSELIASNLMKLAVEIKGRPGVKHVHVCSVTPRRDLGSFIFSRADSVNNRLRSLCLKTPGVNFIDTREQLDRCPFTGLVRDALHYNKAGASRVLTMIMTSVEAFLA